MTQKDLMEIIITTILYVSSTLAVAGPALPAVPLMDSSTTNPALGVSTMAPEQAVYSPKGPCWEYSRVRAAVILGAAKPSVKALSEKTNCTREASLEHLQRMESDGVVLRDADMCWVRK